MNKVGAGRGGNETICPLRVARVDDRAPLDLNPECIRRCAAGVNDLVGCNAPGPHSGGNALVKLDEFRLEFAPGPR